MCIRLEAAVISSCPSRVHNDSRRPTLRSGVQKLVFSGGVCAQAMLEIHRRARAYRPRPGSGMQKLVFSGGTDGHRHARSTHLTFECHWRAFGGGGRQAVVSIPFCHQVHLTPECHWRAFEGGYAGQHGLQSLHSRRPSVELRPPWAARRKAWGRSAECPEGQKVL